jgi:hypothetical protein
MSSSREHTKASLDNNAIDELLCPDHDERFVRHFCMDDTKAICNVCMHTTHKGHSVVDFVSTKITDVESRKAICDYLDKTLHELNSRKTNLHKLKSMSEIELKKTKKAITQKVWDQMELIQQHLHEQERILHEQIDDQYITLKYHTSKLESLIEEATNCITDLKETAQNMFMPLANNDNLTSAEFPTSWFQERFMEVDLPDRTLDWLSGAATYNPGQLMQLGSVEQLLVKTPKFDPNGMVETSTSLLWEIKTTNIVDLCFVDDGTQSLFFSDVKQTKTGDVFSIHRVDLQGSKIDLTVPVPDYSNHFCTLGTNVANTQATVLTQGDNKSWDTVIIKKNHINCSTLTSKNIRPDGQPVAMAISAAGNIILTTLENPESCCGPTSLRCYHPEGYLLWCENTTERSGKTNQTDLLTPWSICVDPLDRILVADMNAGCVKIFNHKGKHLRTLHPDTCVELTPSSVCTDSTGEIYVAFYDQKVVSKFTANGQFIQHVVRPKAPPKAISVHQDRLAVATENNLYMYELDHR